MTGMPCTMSPVKVVLAMTVGGGSRSEAAMRALNGECNIASTCFFDKSNKL